jgi:hypothetical protein
MSVVAHARDDRELLGMRAQVPEHVVHRTFVQETVVLNLETGRYQGLNPTGGRILDLLDSGLVLGDAAARLAEDYGRPVAEVEQDVCAFCVELLDRGLIELQAHDDG